MYQKFRDCNISIKIRKLFAQSGVPCTALTVNCRRCNETSRGTNDFIFSKTGQVSGLDITPNKSESVEGLQRIIVKEAYRFIIQRYAYSWTTTLASFLHSNTMSARFALIVQAVRK